MGNGALPNGPSYRAHPRLYLRVIRRIAAFDRCNRNKTGHWRKGGAEFPKFGTRDRFESYDSCTESSCKLQLTFRAFFSARNLWSRNVPKSGEIRPRFQKAFAEIPFVSSSPPASANQWRLSGPCPPPWKCSDISVTWAQQPCDTDFRIWVVSALITGQPSARLPA
jgi:hypothetical protein